jgi:alpha-L-fucosidase 2
MTDDRAGPNVLWYARPASEWIEALPVGNGRLGAMVFGRTALDRIQLNEETVWTGGPYDPSREVEPGALAEIRRLVFAGDDFKAHYLFGRTLMGKPVEQMKYQPLGNLWLEFPGHEEVAEYRRQLDLDSAIASVSYRLGDTTFIREVFASPVDQVIVVRLTADRPGQISFKAQLQGERNEAHSNYATDYFRMDGLPPDGLVVRGKSADYMGVPGALRYESRLKALPEGGTLRLDWDALIVTGADAVTLFVAAATNFVSYKDVSGDPLSGSRASTERTIPPSAPWSSSSAATSSSRPRVRGPSRPTSRGSGTRT